MVRLAGSVQRWESLHHPPQPIRHATPTETNMTDRMPFCPKRFGIQLKLRVGYADATDLLGGSADGRVNDKMVVQNIPP
jgi:hypothetical protein